jgi:hypothetical protein
MQKPLLIAIIAAAVIIVGWALYRLSGDAPAEIEAVPELPPTPASPPSAPAPEPAPRPLDLPEPVQEPEIVLPPLPESDPFVRERLEPLALPETWLEQGDYVRRLAVLAENASRGQVPRRQLAFLAPSGPFRVIERDDRTYIDPASYRRYDPYVQRLESIPPDTAARLVSTLEPLIEAALGEIGVTAPPGEVLAAAVREILAVPEVDGDVALEQPSVMYTYADPRLEALTPLQKQVLRMGPDNVRRIKAHLREVAQALELAI